MAGSEEEPEVPVSPVRYTRSVRVSIVSFRFLRPKATEAEQQRRVVGLMCLAVLAGGYATYLFFLKPPPPPDWPQTRAAVIERAGKTGRNLVRWTDQTGTLRTARVGKCALPGNRDGSSLTIAYNPDSHSSYEQAQSVCGPFRLVASTGVALVAGGVAARLLWREIRTPPPTDEDPMFDLL